MLLVCIADADGLLSEWVPILIPPLIQENPMSLHSWQISVVVSGLLCLVCSAPSRADEPASAARQASQKSGDNDAEELLAQLRKLGRSQGRTDTRSERIETCQEIVKVADKLRQLKTDDDTVAEAIKAELDALAMLARLDDEEAAAKLEKLTAELSNDKRPAIANLIKMRNVQRKLDALDPEDKDAVLAFVGEVNDVLLSSPPDVQMLPLARTAVVLLHRIKKRAESAAAAQKYADKFASSKAPEVIVGSVQLASLAGQIMELEGQEKEAGKYYRDFINRFAKNDNSDVRQALGEMETATRRLEMIGKPMSVSGKLLGGKTFDISQYKGKVVLVDFWATWCGPCVAELPNVKEVYTKFHDRGFEVVGISLDSEIDTLRDFVSEKHLAWPILFGDADEADGWSHPMAKKYEVNSIPTAILLDRKGNVVSVHARGERLGDLVGELLR